MTTDNNNLYPHSNIMQPYFVNTATFLKFDNCQKIYINAFLREDESFIFCFGYRWMMPWEVATMRYILCLSS